MPASYLPSQIADISGLRAAMGIGAPITLATDAQRTASTPALNETVYATDTNLFYLGDGVTSGGVAQGSAFTPRQLLRMGVIAPRHRVTGAKIRDAIATGSTANIPAGIGLGHSIMGAAGIGDPTKQWHQVLANNLYAFTGVGAASNWIITNAGVGGQGIANTLMYAADNGDAQAAKTPARNAILNGFSYVCLMTCRNDANALTLAQWTELFRLLLLQLKRRGLDIFVMIDPPQITFPTGAIIDTSNYTAKAEAMRQLAYDHGASVVDLDRHVRDLQACGVAIGGLYADSTHLGISGQAMMAALQYQCMVASPGVSSPPAWDHPAGSVRTQVLSYFDSVAPTLRTPTTGLTGVNLRTSARRLQKAESSFSGYVLTSGQTLVFSYPAPRARGVIVQLLDASTNTGTCTISDNGGTTFATGIVTTGGNAGEICFYYPITTGVDYPIQLTIAAVGGSITVLGLAFVGAELHEYHDVWPGAVEVGTWSAATVNFAANNLPFGSAVAGRQSSTVGDTVTVVWFGSHLTVGFEVSNASGKFTNATDGGGAVTHDCYYGGGTALGTMTNVVYEVTNGWHTTVFTVATKNASSSSNNVKLCGFRAQTMGPDASTLDVAIAVGETRQLTGRWQSAVIIQVLSGSPSIAQFTPGQSTLALGGSGSAIVRLTR